ncbi:alpha/beta fold hydrolase [Tenggerimyces flavus]|uniref:Alpha/beta fold hydrolase n=1 Tax=Tenggerimyces flavus TaxID=1708749 RepID=A0ABV7YLA4_9ACTN|nr:alpha/beta hydrolase [Tenggerimyces flavus]MBM7787656.1 pimeloyl-ACP methyl ester carboxylesterase [Tenggerimyces flavus]
MRTLQLPSLPARISYVDVPGSVPAVVYVGGLGSATTAVFAETVAHPSMRHGRRSVLVDLIGSGWSESSSAFGATIEEHADVVAAVLAELGLRDVVLVGHSLGGSVGIALASRRPDLVSRLVVAEPNLDPGIGQVSAHIAKQDEAFFVERGFSALLAALEREEAWPYHATMRRWDPLILHRTAVSLLAERTPTFREQLCALEVPRTYVLGALSTGEAPAGLAEAGVRIVVIENAGHTMMDDDLDAFAAAVGAAVSGTY